MQARMRLFRQMFVLPDLSTLLTLTPYKSLTRLFLAGPLPSEPNSPKLNRLLPEAVMHQRHNQQIAFSASLRLSSATTIAEAPRKSALRVTKRLKYSRSFRQARPIKLEDFCPHGIYTECYSSYIHDQRYRSSACTYRNTRDTHDLYTRQYSVIRSCIFYWPCYTTEDTETAVAATERQSQPRKVQALES